MGIKKVVDAERLDSAMAASAGAIREKTGDTAEILWDADTGFSEAIRAIPVGGGDAVLPKQVNFYDYEGTVLYAYTVAEAAELTELPALPEHDGLICQGWNWTLDAIKAMGRAVNVGAMYITDDGKTRIYITLPDGRTSPMLGCCPRGTVTVDWGDGTEPDILTGTSVTAVMWTPTHEYARSGDYVITLTVDGSMGFYGDSSSSECCGILRYSSSGDYRNRVYQNAIQNIEIGSGATRIGGYAFYNCYSLGSITIPNSVTYIGNNAFHNCYGLGSVTIPNSATSFGSYVFYNCYSLGSVTISENVTYIANFMFWNCYNLAGITIPDSVTRINTYVFTNCYSLDSITIPNSVTSIGNYAFAGCYILDSITIPNSVTNIDNYMFQNCYNLGSITIPNSVTSIGNNAFYNCYSLGSITIPESVESIAANAFSGCVGVRYYDFTGHTAPPILSNVNAFTGISADCEIRVPAEAAEEWKTETNWATYADYIVGV